ncbi:hypothetical protein LZ554_000137 [Drepanopeziza brunnea f. sp. 'monogermtubi']|nr:hypothetical protein LZ554_000137 [Drepanopeziza brunnea f. sp. 'monogermtubi']
MKPTQALEAAIKKTWQKSDDRELRSTAQARRRNVNDREPPTMEGITQYIATLRQEVKNKRVRPGSSDEMPPYKKTRTQKSEDQVHEGQRLGSTLDIKSARQPSPSIATTSRADRTAIVGRKDNPKVTITIRKEVNDPIRGWTPLSEEKFAYKHEMSDWKDKDQILKLNKWRAAIFHKYFAPLKNHV